MLFTEIVEDFRIRLDDFGGVDDLGNDIAPLYSDERLSKLLVVSIRWLQSRLRIPEQHRIPTSTDWPFVDIFFDINPDFAELIILRALCALQARELAAQWQSGNIKVQLGPTSFQTGSSTGVNIPKHMWDSLSPCAELEAKMINLAAFDPRKINAIYSVLPGRGVGDGMVHNNRMQSRNEIGKSMIQ
jgi:hypothetical protein